MVATINDRNLHIDHFETGQHTALNGFQNSLLHCGNVFTGNHAAHNLVFHLHTTAPFGGLDRDGGVAVLTATTGLFLEESATFGTGGNGLAIGDLRGTRLRLHLKLTHQAVPNNLEVQLTHAGHECLAGFFIGVAFESRIFLGQCL